MIDEAQIQSVPSYRVFSLEQKNRISRLYPFLTKHQITRRVKSLWDSMNIEQKNMYRKTVVSKIRHSASKAHNGSFIVSKPTQSNKNAKMTKPRHINNKSVFYDFESDLKQVKHNNSENDRDCILQHNQSFTKIQSSIANLQLNIQSSSDLWKKTCFPNQKTYSSTGNYLLCSTVPTHVVDETPGLQNGILKRDTEHASKKPKIRVSFNNIDVQINIPNTSPSSSDNCSCRKSEKETCVVKQDNIRVGSNAKQRKRRHMNMRYSEDQLVCPDFDEIDRFEMNIVTNNFNHSKYNNTILSGFSLAVEGNKCEKSDKSFYEHKILSGKRNAEKISQKDIKMNNSTPDANVLPPLLPSSQATPEFRSEFNIKTPLILDNATYELLHTHESGDGTNKSTNTHTVLNDMTPQKRKCQGRKNKSLKTISAKVQIIPEVAKQTTVNTRSKSSARAKSGKTNDMESIGNCATKEKNIDSDSKNEYILRRNTVYLNKVFEQPNNNRSNKWWSCNNTPTVTNTDFETIIDDIEIEMNVTSDDSQSVVDKVIKEMRASVSILPGTPMKVRLSPTIEILPEMDFLYGKPEVGNEVPDDWIDFISTKPNSKLCNSPPDYQNAHTEGVLCNMFNESTPRRDVKAPKSSRIVYSAKRKGICNFEQMFDKEEIFDI